MSSGAVNSSFYLPDWMWLGCPGWDGSEISAADNIYCLQKWALELRMDPLNAKHDWTVNNELQLTE